jgi:hypothetical protein
MFFDWSVAEWRDLRFLFLVDPQTNFCFSCQGAMFAPVGFGDGGQLTGRPQILSAEAM